MRGIIIIPFLVIVSFGFSQSGSVDDERALYSSVYEFSHDLAPAAIYDTTAFITWIKTQHQNADTSYRWRENFDKKAQKQFSKAIKKHLEGFKYIPAGSYNARANDSDLPFESASRSKVVSLDAFYMLDHELTVGEYKQYLSQLNEEERKAALPKSYKWGTLGTNYDSLASLYMNDERFNDYPIVNISYDQVFAYCKWLTAQLRNDEEIESPNIIARIAFEEEWEYAARGGLDYSPYPWGGPYLRNSKGCFLANFRVIDPLRGKYGPDSLPMLIEVEEEALTIDDLNMPKPVRSYHPNGFGLYNMAGNAAEFVLQHGISRGGSFYETGYYLQNSVRRFYDRDNSALPSMGVRIVVTL